MAGINRYKLLEQLELVEPALADTETVPVFANFLFAGRRLLAYNDRIAISVPLTTDFKGAVPGKELLKMVRSYTHSDTVNIVADNGRAKITAGTAKGNLSLLAPEAFISVFKMPTLPNESEGALWPDGSALFTAIEDLLQSVGEKNATKEDEMGITFIPENGDHIRMYSTNHRTISYSRQKLPKLKLQKRMLLPAEFCRQMLRLSKLTGEHEQLVIKNDHALYINDKAVLFGRVLTSNDPVDFDNILKSKLPANLPRAMAKLDSEGEQRDRLKVALNIVTSLDDGENKTSIEVKDNVIKLHSVNGKGHEARDEVKVVSHPTITAKFNASLILGGYDRYDDILLTKNCAILKRGENLYLVAPYS